MRAWLLITAGLLALPVVPLAAKRLPVANASVLARAKTTVSASLKDARTAQFRNVRKAADPDRQRVCGEVNAKNAYGGYVGFQKFVYFPDTGESEILDEDFQSPTYVREQAKKFGSCF